MSKKINNPKPETKKAETPFSPWFNDKIMLGLTAVLIGLYYYYSKISTGFYQHDEIAHFFNMRDFWNNPNAILGNWPKTGYKLIYAAPSLLGSNFLIFFNALLSALSCFIAYKTAKIFSEKWAPLAFFLLAAQPFWIELSFRNFADSFSGLILLLGVWAYYKDKLVLSSLFISYSTLIRQEFLLIGVAMGIYLLIKQKWVPAFLLALFPLLYNLWGYMATGQPLYLITSATETSDLYSSTFVKHGFFHFFKMSMVVWGSLSSALVFLALIFVIKDFKIINKSESPNIIPAVIAFLIYFLIHGVFNWEAVNFGASPNLRYMNAIGPLMAVIAVWAFEHYNQSNEKNNSLAGKISIIIWVVLVLVFQTKENNGVVFTDKKDMLPFGLAIVSLAALLIPIKNNAKLSLLIAAALVGSLPLLQPRKLTPEEAEMDKISKLVIKNENPQAKVFCNHTMYSYFYEKQTGKIPTNVVSMDSTGILESPQGSIVLWETHYSFRKDFPSVSFEFLQANQDKFEFLQQFESKDKRFQAIVIKKK